jgi:hypothetical protein
MKHFEFDLPVETLRISLLVVVAILITAADTRADYQLTWSTIDGGGRQSAGGPNFFRVCD